MSDRNEKRSENADSGRKGLGDDQGTRVGSPSPGSERDRTREPAHLSDSLGEKGTQEAKGKPTGAGAEAAEGVHATQGREPGDRSALEGVDTGRTKFDEATVERAGSEPIQREREHKSGYGGDGGAPKTSSDRREPLEPEGHRE